MRLCTFSIGGERRLGAGKDESRIVDVVTAAKELGREVPAADLLTLIEAGPEAIAAVGELLGAVGGRSDANWIHDLDQVVLHHPYRPVKNITKAHGNSTLACGKPREGAPIVLPPGRWLGGFPIRYHTKAPTAVLDPGAPIAWPNELARQVYAEPQLAIVIGETIHYAEPDDVAGKIAGYAVATDVSSEDLKTKHGQWPKAVSLDSFFPWGPFVVTADEIDDADALDVSLELNGATVISANTSETLISIAEMLAELSLGIKLDPGDVLMLGVPECLAFGEEPPRWLRAGDTLTSRIDGVGRLTNPVAPY